MTRLIDLHTDWLLQYAPETVLFDPELYPGTSERLGQAEGYLGNTRAAVLACYRQEMDWATQADPWKALTDLIARIEAEFAGRILMGPDDWARFQAEPEGLTWAVIGVEGFDAIIRSAADLRLLPVLHERGVRLFQPIYGEGTILGGSSRPGDDRRLTDVGREFLETLLRIGEQPDQPRPIVDLAHMNPETASDALTWFEADVARSRNLIPVFSHGALRNEFCPDSRALTFENMARLRKMRGVVGLSVGPPFYDKPEALKQSLVAVSETPFGDAPGFHGVAIGTDFLGVSRVLPALSNAEKVIGWILSEFDPAAAHAILWRSAHELLQRMMRVEADPPPAS
jgi:membrane dipeptidase